MSKKRNRRKSPKTRQPEAGRPAASRDPRTLALWAMLFAMVTLILCVLENVKHRLL